MPKAQNPKTPKPRGPKFYRVFYGVDYKILLRSLILDIHIDTTVKNFQLKQRSYLFAIYVTVVNAISKNLMMKTFAVTCLLAAAGYAVRIQDKFSKTSVVDDLVALGHLQEQVDEGLEGGLLIDDFKLDLDLEEQEKVAVGSLED